MECRSVACIWSETPPSHRVTTTAVLDQPPTIYTGGSDGSIIRWNLSSTDPKSEIKPIAMLCGHAAPLADLDVCDPVVASGSDKACSLSNVAVNSGYNNYSALISACSDGVLCVWSRGSGHCRRRRKLPPWVGSPSMVRTLKSQPRYVCISCCFVDTVHLSDGHSIDSIEGSEVLVDRESQHKKPSKCTVVIIDTYTLTIVQTVFHGKLSIGSLRFMDVVSLTKEKERHYVVMADSYGRLQFVSITNNHQNNREGGIGSLDSSSQLEMPVWAEAIYELEQIVSIVTWGALIVFVLKSRCIFKLLDCGTTIGEISVMDRSLCQEGDCSLSHVAGAVFLESDNVGDVLNTLEPGEIHPRQFAVWNRKGLLIVYLISYLKDVFTCELFGEIPASSYPPGVRVSACFTQLNRYLLRVESLCSSSEEPLLWRPLITTWSPQPRHDNCGKHSLEFRMNGLGCPFADWNGLSTLHETEGNGEREAEPLLFQGSLSNSKCINNTHKKEGRVVSSSMIIAETHLAPNAVVYGFFNGEIEVVQFDLFEELVTNAGSPRHEIDSHASRQYFFGHRGAILCLAAHWMVGAVKGHSFSQLLVSGSMDCTVRIWDLGTGNIITVLHHHVAPVRQIILPPAYTEQPWNDCFLSVGEDSCVALTSLETLRVERMFPGHPNHPAKVVWDSVRGYIACLCQNHSRSSDAVDILYIWDVKTGARERVLRGPASHSMFDHFCKSIIVNSISGTILNLNTSVSSLLFQTIDDGISSHSNLHNLETPSNVVPSTRVESSTSQSYVSNGHPVKLFPTNSLIPHIKKIAIKCLSPFPGIVGLSFDLASLMFPFQKCDSMSNGNEKRERNMVKEREIVTSSRNHKTLDNNSDISVISNVAELDWIRSLEECLLRFSLSFLHLWNVDLELDRLLVTDMKLKRPDNFIVASGLQGDKGSLTLTFPDLNAILELWKTSSEFCAMRSLTMVSLAQRMLSLSHSGSSASSALAAFYTRNFADQFPDMKPPLLQLLVSFWQDESEHIRMAARSLFHCAASRAIPRPLCSQKVTDGAMTSSVIGAREIDLKISKEVQTPPDFVYHHQLTETQKTSQVEESDIVAWLESFEMQDWISCVGGTSQDAMASHIVVAAALAIWYPSLVKPCLSMLSVHPLIKLVMAMNEKFSSTAAELLAEGMECTWKSCITSEIPRLIGDIFFQIECVSGPSVSIPVKNSVVPAAIREALVGVLLPSLAVADVPGFLTVIESQIWSTASDSPVHLVSIMTLIRVVHGSPRHLAQHLDKVVNFILLTMDPSNSVLRKTCFQSSMTALKEVARVFPMVALNKSWTKLAVGDVIGEINSASIRIYDMQSVVKMKVLGVSGPPGLPTLLAPASETVPVTAISALSFSPDGEGLVAFSEHGLMIRWWSLESVWWEKLSRNLVPIQCTKVIFVPPWEGFSPNSSRASIMASIMGHEKPVNFQDDAKDLSHGESLKTLLHNLDLSYRLEWVSERKVLLKRHGQELGTFLL